MAENRSCQLAALPPQLFENVMLRLDGKALSHLIQTRKAFHASIQPFLWVDPSLNLTRMRPIDSERKNGQLIRTHTLTLELRFGTISDCMVALNFRNLCRHGMEYASLRVLKFWDNSALDLSNWKLLETVLTSQHSTLSTTLRTIHFPRTSPQRDDSNPSRKFFAKEVITGDRPRGVWTKAGRPCNVKTIQLKSQSYERVKDQKSYRIKPPVVYVFEY